MFLQDISTMFVSERPSRTDYKGNGFLKNFSLRLAIVIVPRKIRRLLCCWLSVRVDWPVTTSDPGEDGGAPLCPAADHYCAGFVLRRVRVCAYIAIHSYVRPAPRIRLTHARTRAARLSSATIITARPGQEVATVAHISARESRQKVRIRGSPDRKRPRVSLARKDDSFLRS